VIAAAIPLITGVGSWIITRTLNAPEIALATTGLVSVEGELCEVRVYGVSRKLSPSQLSYRAMR
jgi:hypothetical protein